MGYRISGIFQDQWELGTSLYHGAWDDEGDYSVNMLGFHVLGRMGNFSLYAEYAKAFSENPDPQEKGNMDGYFIQGSYLFMDKFRPTIRFGNLDYLDLGNQLGRKATDFDRMILALGLNYYLTNSIVFKFEYDFYFPGEREEDTNKNLLALQAAFRF
jgi:hypothetical protein